MKMSKKGVLGLKVDLNKGRGMKTSKEWVWDVKEDFDKGEE